MIFLAEAECNGLLIVFIPIALIIGLAIITPIIAISAAITKGDENSENSFIQNFLIGQRKDMENDIKQIEKRFGPNWDGKFPKK